MQDRAIDLSCKYHDRVRRLWLAPASVRQPNMRRFSTFPNGPFGAGLLLLRGAVGAALVILACSWFAGAEWTATKLAVGAVIAASGVLVIFGFRTRLAIVTGLVVAAGALWWSPAAGALVLNGKVAGLMIAVAAAAVALAGPGAHSLDARLFGRREINIP
jgi:uncharacterized membrane protein YphA (DoxX/SURF4 family)